MHWSSVGNCVAPDSDLATFAHRERYVILTRDLDFGTILSVRRLEQPSVIQLRVKRAAPLQIAASVIDVNRSAADELERGALITLDPKRTRLRVLPLARARETL